MGASVTATGRQITTFMMETIGEYISGSPIKIIKKSCVEKDGTVVNTYHGDNNIIIYGDTDSVAADSMVRSNMGHTTIEQLFKKGTEFTTLPDGREFSRLPGLTSLTSDGDNVFEKPVRTIYRHKVKKQKWRITLASGKQVVVTNDHSVMVKRNGKLIEVKPSEINCATDIAVELRIA